MNVKYNHPGSISAIIIRKYVLTDALDKAVEVTIGEQGLLQFPEKEL